MLPRLQSAAWAQKRGADSFRPNYLRRDDLRYTEVEVLPPNLTGPAEALRDLERHLQRDELTGLPDHAGLTQLVSTLDHRAAFGAGPVEMGVVCFDLDNFGQINQGLGTAAGDEVLRQVAARLRQTSRQDDDVVMRLGGDQFLLLMPCAVGQGAELVEPVATRILSALRRPMRWLTTVDVETGASAGAAVWRRGRTPLTTVIAQADEALFAAKRAGRGRFRQYAARAAGSTIGAPAPDAVDRSRGAQ